jgi:hypothetical protein
MKQFRPFLLATALISAIGCLAAPAYADIISVTGSTTGTFSPSLNHLSFAGDSFGPTTSDSITLGTFNLDNGSTNYNGDTFDLTVTFTAPAGAGSKSVTGDLTGSVTGGSGSVTITFTNPTLFTFSGGSFDLSANTVTANLDVNSGLATLTGTLSNESLGSSAVPEPTSVALLVTVLVGVGFGLRKKFSPAIES